MQPPFSSSTPPPPPPFLRRRSLRLVSLDTVSDDDDGLGEKKKKKKKNKEEINITNPSSLFGIVSPSSSAPSPPPNKNNTASSSSSISSSVAAIPDFTAFAYNDGNNNNNKLLLDKSVDQKNEESKNPSSSPVIIRRRISPRNASSSAAVVSPGSDNNNTSKNDDLNSPSSSASVKISYGDSPGVAIMNPLRSAESCEGESGVNAASDDDDKDEDDDDEAGRTRKSDKSAKTSPPRRKGQQQRKRRSSSSSASSTSSPESGSPRRQSRKRERKKQPGTTISPPPPPPPGWESIYELVKELRSDRTAPVDSDGASALPERHRGEVVFRYQTLIALMLSSQTKDAVVGETVRGLQEHGLNLENILKTSDETLNKLIYKVGFRNNKTKYIKEVSEILKIKYNGDIPPNAKEMIDELPGVGPKMAYIIEQIAFNTTSGIGIDTHMHRIFNILNWVNNTKTPEKTRIELERWLPREKWNEINVLFVGFGQEVQQQKEKMMKKVLTCSKPVEALKLVKKLGLDYIKEGKKYGLYDEIQRTLLSSEEDDGKKEEERREEDTS